jgi:hypothetical protein
VHATGGVCGRWAILILNAEVVRLGRVGCGSPLDRGAEAVGLHKGVGPSFFSLGVFWGRGGLFHCMFIA